MSSISNADMALLGLLSEEPMHAWQIEKEVRERDMRFWTDLSQSTIYKQLRALEKAQLIDCREEVAEGRLRKIYSLTDAGRLAYRDRTCELLARPEHLKWRVDLATYNVDLLPRDVVLECLARYRAELEKDIKGYGDLEGFLVASGCPAHRLSLARRPVRLMRAEIAWLDDFVREIEEGTIETGRTAAGLPVAAGSPAAAEPMDTDADA